MQWKNKFCNTKPNLLKWLFTISLMVMVYHNIIDFNNYWDRLNMNRVKQRNYCWVSQRVRSLLIVAWNCNWNKVQDCNNWVCICIMYNKSGRGVLFWFEPTVISKMCPVTDWFQQSYLMEHPLTWFLFWFR